MQELTSTRSNALVDPGLHVWHGEVAGYLFLGGLVAGVMVLLGGWLLLRPRERRSRELALLPWAAPVLLSLGMFFLWLDLENPWNAFRFYLTFEPASPMSWGAWILLAVYPAAIALAWVTSPGALRDGVVERAVRLDARVGRLLASASARLLEGERGVAAAAVVAGAALGVYTGLLLGTLAARPLWSSPILGPLFLVSGLSTGAAFLLLHRIDPEERKVLGRLDMALIALELALIGVWLVGLLSGGAAGRAAAGLVLGGPYTAAFWTLVVALGLLAPLAGEWLELRRGLAPGRATAVLVLTGGFALRWILVYAGQHAGWVDAATEVARALPGGHGS